MLKKASLAMLSLLVCLPALASCHAWYRLRKPVSMHGESPEFLNYKNVFLAYYDPNIPKERLLEALERGYAEWDLLTENFFPNASEKIHVIVYKDRNSYNQHAGNLPKSLARFDRRTNRIYLAQDTGRQAWRHELVHAILDGIRPADYRVQEGLAWFLQYQNLLKNTNCKKAPHSRPLPFQSYLPQLRRKPPSLQDFFSSRKHSMTDVSFLARNAYYMEFIWSRKKLKKSIDYYTKHPHAHFEYEITRGDYIRLKKLYKDFNQWLKSPAPLRGSPGC